ncbi:MAG: helix-turn-helix domain-containing protein [Rhodothermales bacterium]|nr:helix-turn-helix domain-containing protein [Rhodothermales bacterium]
MSDDAVLRELGARLERARLDVDMTQARLAEEAGVSKSTVERLEKGGSVQLANLIRVLRAIGLLRNMDDLIPPVGPRPVELLNMQGKQRQRASGTRKDPTETDWTWGDE